MLQHGNYLMCPDCTVGFEIKTVRPELGILDQYKWLDLCTKDKNLI
jgi:hypothetical protein